MIGLLLILAVSAAPAVLPLEPAVPEHETDTLVIDDFSLDYGVSALGTRWSAVSDRVMGGVSDVEAELSAEGRRHLHLTGVVREVPGSGSAGFVQLGLDLADLDARGWAGISLLVKGDGQAYGAHLRTPDVRRPWESWRASFPTSAEWTEVRIPFEDFHPHRMGGPLDLEHLSRLSLIAVDRLGEADLRVAEVKLYR